MWRQVVHLFAEMRKIMPEAMEVTYAETEPQRPRGSKKATVSDEISEEAKVQPHSHPHPPVPHHLSLFPFLLHED